MEIILVSGFGRGAWRRVHLGSGGTALLLCTGLGLILGAAFLGYRSAPTTPDTKVDLYVAAWAGEIRSLRQKVIEARRATSDDLDALSLRIGDLQARILRLDALGHRLVDMAQLDGDEFHFAASPPLGGADPRGEGEPPPAMNVSGELDALLRQLDDRALKLRAIESELMSAKLHAEVVPSGRPVKQGWISSGFGWRTDPFSGKRSFHDGIDFAGKFRSDVVAVASGVVMRIHNHPGLGKTVEVDHGGGYATRYAHNDRILVTEGETVKKGQPIALLGNTGRSTGPHLHFEVRLNGKAVNPIDFVRPDK